MKRNVQRVALLSQTFHIEIHHLKIYRTHFHTIVTGDVDASDALPVTIPERAAAERRRAKPTTAAPRGSGPGRT